QQVSRRYKRPHKDSSNTDDQNVRHQCNQRSYYKTYKKRPRDQDPGWLLSSTERLEKISSLFLLVIASIYINTILSEILRRGRGF
ncbi:hypothetical protein GIB67_038551, partial [Kingdonia uniflora]